MDWRRGGTISDTTANRRLRDYSASATVPTMSETEYLTLAEWAERNGISRRKAEMLAHEVGFPAVRQKRKIARTIWQTMVPADYKLL